MANEICTSLRLIDKDLSGKLLHIVEDHGSNASFMIGSLMWNASRTGTSVCLLALHNSLSHYKNVTKKLGFNLKGAVDDKTAVVLEPFNMYFEKTRNFDDIDVGKEENLRRLFFDVKEALSGFSGKKCLIVDELSDLMCMGSTLSSVISFLQCCRTLQEDDKELCLIVCCHRSEVNEDQRLLADFIAHVAEWRVTVAGLKTGFSTNVTGSIEVLDNLEDEFPTATDKRLFHFKLTDRQIKVFAPGTVGIQI